MPPSRFNLRLLPLLPTEDNESSLRFWWGTKGFHTEIGFPTAPHKVVGDPYGSRQLSLLTPSLRPDSSYSCCRYGLWLLFISTISFTDEQIAAATSPRSGIRTVTHESIITTLRVNEVMDRDTFVNMFDSETALEEGAADLGIDMTSGGLPHKREFARVVAAWKTSMVGPRQRCRPTQSRELMGFPVTLLPSDWMSILTEIRKKYGNHISDERQPAQSMFEQISEKLAVCSKKNSRKRRSRNRHVSTVGLQTDDHNKTSPISSDLTDEKDQRRKYAVLTTSGSRPKCVSQGGRITKTWTEPLLQTSLIPCWTRTTSILIRKSTAARSFHRVGLSVCPASLKCESHQTLQGNSHGQIWTSTKTGFSSDWRDGFRRLSHIQSSRSWSQILGTLCIRRYF